MAEDHAEDRADEDPLTKIAVNLARSIHPMFAGHPAPVIGAALADLTSLWIAGHIADGPPSETRHLREELLNEHLKAVKKLIPIQADMLIERMAATPRSN